MIDLEAIQRSIIEKSLKYQSQNKLLKYVNEVWQEINPTGQIL